MPTATFRSPTTRPSSGRPRPSTRSGVQRPRRHDRPATSGTSTATAATRPTPATRLTSACASQTTTVLRRRSRTRSAWCRPNRRPPPRSPTRPSPAHRRPDRELRRHAARATPTGRSPSTSGTSTATASTTPTGITATPRLHERRHLRGDPARHRQLGAPPTVSTQSVTVSAAAPQTYAQAIQATSGLLHYWRMGESTARRSPTARARAPRRRERGHPGRPRSDRRRRQHRRQLQRHLELGQAAASTCRTPARSRSSSG